MGKRYCCIDSCPNRQKCPNEVSLFLPPKDPHLFQKWAEMVKPHRRRPVTRTTGVCEFHFQPEEILREFVTKMNDGSEHRIARGRVSLAAGVYPTIFQRNLKKKKSKESFHIEVKAPSTSEKEVTYIFDIGDDDPDDPEFSPSDDKLLMDDAKANKVVRKRGRPKKNLQKLRSDPKCDENDVGSDRVLFKSKTPLILRRSTKPVPKVDEDEMVVSEGVDPNQTLDDSSGSVDLKDESNDSNVVSDGSISPVFVALDEIPNLAELDCCGDPAPTEPTSSDVPSTDLRQILDDDCETEKSIIQNDEVFKRLCRNYIVSHVNDRGRKSDLEMSKPSPKKSRIDDDEAKDVFIYPTTNNLDAISLVYNIDRVKYPSSSWFCTIKEGAPAFLCWGEGYTIKKKVIFDSRTLDPTIMVGDNEVKLSEVIRPRSIKEVGSILKLADSVELCQRYNDTVRPYTNCKGYFFRVQTDNPDVTQCPLCRYQKTNPYLECKKTEERLTFDEICQAAESLVKERESWSYTVIGSAVVFIGWLKQYRMEKLYIVSRDISTRIMMGNEFVDIDKIKYIKTLDDITAALDFLSTCKKCAGINIMEPKCNTRRAEECMGFVTEGNPSSRVPRCKTCSHTRNKVRLRNHRQRLKGQFVRSSGELYPPLKTKTRSLDKTSFEEELTVEDDELSDEGWLVDVLEKVTFPSTSWSYVVVDNSIIFQNWDESFVVSKKIIINPDLNVLIYVMDNHVEIEAVQSVENVDDVMRLLNIVECIQICEGVDDSNSKSEGCTGYYYDPEAKNSNLNAPKRCPKCSKEYLLFTRREQRWIKKLAMGQADLTSTGDIILNVKQSSLEVSVEDNSSVISER